MSVKALKRQLAAAIAMVLVATIALSSSTFAWFASNSQVKATGMQVQATAEGGIEICYVTNGSDGAYSTTATAGMTSSRTLYPTSTAASATSGTISTWHHAKAALKSASTALSGTYQTLTLSNSGYETSTGNCYFLVQNFKIRAVSSVKSASNLVVSGIDVTGSSQALSHSLRVAVVDGSNVAIYAPTRSASGSETGITYSVASSVSSGTGTAASNSSVTALYPTTTSSVLNSTITSTGDSISIYVWYEGEDTEHYSDNLATTLDTISLSVNFSATV